MKDYYELIRIIETRGTKRYNHQTSRIIEQLRKIIPEKEIRKCFVQISMNNVSGSFNILYNNLWYSFIITQDHNIEYKMIPIHKIKLIERTMDTLSNIVKWKISYDESEINIEDHINNANEIEEIINNL